MNRAISQALVQSALQQPRRSVAGLLLKQALGTISWPSVIGGAVAVKVAGPVLQPAVKLAMTPALALHETWIDAQNERNQARFSAQMQTQNQMTAVLNQISASLKELQEDVATLKAKAPKT